MRWAESKKRKSRGIFEKSAIKPDNRIILMNDNDDKRMLFENCRMKAKRVCNPIIDFADSDIWNFIRSEKLEYNIMYDQGHHRVGCVGCPMAGKNRYMEFRMYPTYERAYRRAFAEMLRKMEEEQPLKERAWKNADDVFRWWMEDENIKGQMEIKNFIEV